VLRFRRLLACILALALTLQSVGQVLASSDINQILQYTNNSLGPTAAANSEHTNPYGTFYASRRDAVHPGNGNITVEETDLVLTGRNGLNLVLSRIYQNQQANVYQMATEVVAHQQSYWVAGYWEPYTIHHPGYWGSRWVAGYYICSTESYWVEGYFETVVAWDEYQNLYWYYVWVPGYWASRHVCVEVPGYWESFWVPGWTETASRWVPGYWDYYWTSEVVSSRTSATHHDRRNALGVGWQWNLPSLEVRGSEIIYHNNGQALQVD